MPAFNLTEWPEWPFFMGRQTMTGCGSLRCPASMQVLLKLQRECTGAFKTGSILEISCRFQEISHGSKDRADRWAKLLSKTLHGSGRNSNADQKLTILLSPAR